MTDSEDEDLLARSYREEAEQRHKLWEMCESAAVVEERVVQALGEERPALLLARGMYSPSPRTAERVMVIALGDAEPVKLNDSWMTKVERKALQQGLKRRWDALPGHCDAMYATTWNLAWTDGERGRFQLWSPKERLLAIEGDRLRLSENRGDLVARDVRAVVGWLSDDWVRREVRLKLRSGGEVLVIGQDDDMPAIDPTYDSFNLFCDAAWVVDLTRSIAKAVGVPFEMHPDLG